MPIFNFFPKTVWLSESRFKAMIAEFQQNGQSVIFDTFCKEEKIATFCKKVAQQRLRDTHLKSDYEDIGADAYIKWQRQLPHSIYAEFTPAMLTTIIQNYCVDKLREKFSTQIATTDFTNGRLDALMNDDAELERRIYQEKLLDKLSAALKQLRPNCQQLLHWKYKDEFAFEEIAQRLAINIGASKERFYTCRERLKTLIGNPVHL